MLGNGCKSRIHSWNSNIRGNNVVHLLLLDQSLLSREEPGAVLVNVSNQQPPNTVAVTQIATAPINTNYPLQILIRQPQGDIPYQSHASELNTTNAYSHGGNNPTYFDAPPPYPGLPSNRESN